MNLYIFNWRIIVLQYCTGFCHTSTWISQRYTYVPSHLNLPPTSYPTPLGCHRAPGLGSPCHPPVRIAIIKKSTNNKGWRGCEEKGTVLHCWWECELIYPLWKTVQRFLKKSRNKTTIWPTIPTTGHIL